MANVSVKGAAKTAKAEERRVIDEQKKAEANRAATVDSFVNFAQNVGIGGDNPLTTAGYGFNPVTRQRVQLEWMHRGTWIAKLAVNLPADDMTREGVDILGDMKPEKMEEVEEMVQALGVWNCLGETVAWSRLYGGAIAVMQIDGQREDTPLRIEAVPRDSFKGLLVFDRWMVEPSLNRMVKTPGPDRGLPEFYTIRSDAHAMQGTRVHHSRVIRLIGDKLPYMQAVIEQMWGASVLEGVWDRMTAFDSTSTGAAQLVYRAWIRSLKIKNLRSIVGGPPQAQKGLVAQLQFMRRYANSEGFIAIDGDDEIDVLNPPAFSGLSDVMLSFGEQLAGALQIPLVRLFGQSPKGLNATGESDLMIYADNVRKNQNRDLKDGVTRIYRVAAMSMGVRPPKGFGVRFKPLYQLNDQDKGDVAEKRGRAISQAWNDGVISPQTYLRELKQGAGITGLFSNITADDIEAAEESPPPTAPGLEGDPDASSSSSGSGPSKDSERSGERGSEKKETKKPDPKKKATNDSFPVVAALKLHHDLDVVIESKRGEVRRGPGWEIFLPDDYGYIMGTQAPDGEQVDCYVGGDARAEKVWVVHQNNLDGTPDEPKVMLGYSTMQDAMKTYLSGFTDGSGWKRVGGVVALSMDMFKSWVKEQRRPS